MVTAWQRSSGRAKKTLMSTATKSPATALVAITGNTYPVKDALKALGAKWASFEKCWMIAAKKAAKAQAIVDAAVAPAPAFVPGPDAKTIRTMPYSVRGGKLTAMGPLKSTGRTDGPLVASNPLPGDAQYGRGYIMISANEIKAGDIVNEGGTLWVVMGKSPICEKRVELTEINEDKNHAGVVSTGQYTTQEVQDILLRRI